MILDTDILIALLKGDKTANKAIERLDESGGQLVTTVLTAYEGNGHESKSRVRFSNLQSLICGNPLFWYVFIRGSINLADAWNGLESGF